MCLGILTIPSVYAFLVESLFSNMQSTSGWQLSASLLRRHQESSSIKNSTDAALALSSATKSHQFVVHEALV